MKINENKIKKFTLLAAILAPMIYLFGSLFAQLQGSHGNIVLADIDNPTTSFVKNRVIDNTICTIIVGENFTLTSSGGNYVVDLGSLPAGNYKLSFNRSSAGSVRFIKVDSSNIVTYVEGLGSDFVAFTSDGLTSYFIRTTYERVSPDAYSFTSYPSSFGDTLSASQSSDYLFTQFFVKDNFLSVSGEKVIEGAPDYGFKPAADLIRYIDGNMLHLANLEWGYLVIGYVYYAFHVTIVFLLFELLMFFPHLIENIYEKFERGW